MLNPEGPRQQHGRGGSQPRGGGYSGCVPAADREGEDQLGAGKSGS